MEMCILHKGLGIIWGEIGAVSTMGSFPNQKYHQIKVSWSNFCIIKFGQGFQDAVEKVI